jgi:hypothetical protein
MLTHGYWQRRFGSSESVIGQPLEVDGLPAEVIGVLPSTFKFLDSKPTVLLPMQLDRATAFRGIEFDFQALARLKPGVTFSQANADLARMISLLPPAFGTLQLQPDVRPLADDHEVVPVDEDGLPLEPELLDDAPIVEIEADSLEPVDGGGEGEGEGSGTEAHAGAGRGCDGAGP